MDVNRVCLIFNTCDDAAAQTCSLLKTTHWRGFRHLRSEEEELCGMRSSNMLVCVLCCSVAVLGASAQTEEEEGEVLDRHRCLLALAALRHAKWFQVGTRSLPVFLPMLVVA